MDSVDLMKKNNIKKIKKHLFVFIFYLFLFILIFVFLLYSVICQPSLLLFSLLLLIMAFRICHLNTIYCANDTFYGDYMLRKYYKNSNSKITLHNIDFVGRA